MLSLWASQRPFETGPSQWQEFLLRRHDTSNPVSSMEFKCRDFIDKLWWNCLFFFLKHKMTFYFHFKSWEGQADHHMSSWASWPRMETTGLPLTTLPPTPRGSHVFRVIPAIYSSASWVICIWAAAGISAVCFLPPQPVPSSPPPAGNSFAFVELLLPRWVLLSFHVALLFIYFYPQAYSVCPIVWIVMNFGFNSRESKACFQLNKPNEVKSFILLLTLFSLPIPVGRMSKECSL